MTFYGKAICCSECKGYNIHATPPIQISPELVGRRVSSRQSSVFNCIDCGHIWHGSWVNNEEVDKIISVEQRSLRCI